AKAVSKDAAGGPDTAGPFNTVVLSEWTGGMAPTKILVTGNSTFASDALMNQNNAYYNPYGGIFLVYALNYMQDRNDDQVVIPAKTYENRQIDISQSEAQTLGISVVIIYPLLMLGLGLFVWIKRRHL
ncbi:MAG TPA: ABC transporter, partial [Clostridiales bacterium]|nr:ABC transporter [Clostridiales bacterium]